MGGQILDYEAKRIRNEGIRIGQREGRREGAEEATAATLNKVAEQMIRCRAEGEMISDVTGFGREKIDRMAKDMKITVVWKEIR